LYFNVFFHFLILRIKKDSLGIKIPRVAYISGLKSRSFSAFRQFFYNAGAAEVVRAIKKKSRNKTKRQSEELRRKKKKKRDRKRNRRRRSSRRAAHDEDPVTTEEKDVNVRMKNRKARRDSTDEAKTDRVARAGAAADAPADEGGVEWQNTRRKRAVTRRTRRVAE
jgi:hypothetical protein